MHQSFAVCDHYTGSVKFLLKALEIQNNTTPFFEITCDLEDGAEKGEEKSLLNDLINIFLSNKNKLNKTGFRLLSSKHKLFKSIASDILTKCPVEKINHLTIPKIKSYQELIQIKKFLSEVITSRGSTSLPPLRVLIEDYSILDDLEKIASDPDVQSLDFGIMDFISSLDSRIPIEECTSLNEFNNSFLNYVKNRIVLSCIKYKKTATHSVCREFKNLNTIKEFCTSAKKIGFDKMWSIHPEQITIIQDTFLPNKNERNEALHILKSAKEKSWGPVSFKDTLHDNASYIYYYKLLKKWADSGGEISENIEALKPETPII